MIRREEPVAAPQPGGAPDKVLRSLPVRIARWASGVVGFTATVLGLVFVLFPALKPEPPPPVKGATLTNATPEQLTWGQYLDRDDVDRAPYDAAALRRRGIYVEFDYTIEGYKDKPLPLRWQLIDAQSGEQLGNARDTHITALANSDRGTQPVWVQLPQRPARLVYVQLQFFEPKGVVSIGRVRTPSLRVARRS